MSLTPEEEIVLCMAICAVLVLLVALIRAWDTRATRCFYSKRGMRPPPPWR